MALRVLAEPAHPALPQGTWVALRDFLRYGLDEPTGDGDVRIRPQGDRLELDLVSGARRCRIQVAAAAVRAFLDTTVQSTPAALRTMVWVRGCSAATSWKYDESRLRRLFALPT